MLPLRWGQLSLEVNMYVVLKNCRADGIALKAGDVVELKDNVAQALLNIGRVEVASDKAKIITEEPVVEVAVQDRKEKPKRTRKAK